MSSDAALIVCGTLLLILCMGEPDLLDALINWAHEANTVEVVRDE